VKLLVGIIGTIYDLKTPFMQEMVNVVTQNIGSDSKERVLYNAENFIAYFQEMGCHACLISPNEDPAILRKIDILVIPGGPDVNPALYGQEPHRTTEYQKEGPRDFFEQQMIKDAIEMEKPIFALCRGLQILNVALGGTLHQHLPEWSDEVSHRSAEGPAEYTHSVTLTGWLVDIYGNETRVNSWHHQGIDKLASSLQPLAWSSDGLVEAVESKSNSSQILAVQWHPEILQDEESKMLLTRFLARAKTKINVGGI